VADEFATRNEVNNVGKCITEVKVMQAQCCADKHARIKTLEKWTDEQETKLDDLNKANQKLEVQVTGMTNDIVNKLSTRTGLMVAVMTVILAALMFLK